MKSPCQQSPEGEGTGLMLMMWKPRWQVRSASSTFSDPSCLTLA
jgi:hypothetical protein